MEQQTTQENGAEDRPLYSSRIIQNYLKLVRKKYPHVDVDKVLAHAGMEIFQVEDGGHWFTQSQINRFHEKLEPMSGSANIAHEAGAYVASGESMGDVTKYIMRLMSPARAYELIGRMSSKFSRSSTYTSRKTGSNQVEVVVTPKEGVQEQPFQCENRKGYLEAISKVFNYKLPQVEHPECIFRGGGSCRYLVSWEPSHAAHWKKIRNISIPALALLCLIIFMAFPAIPVTTLIPSSVVLILILSLYAERLDSQELTAALDKVQDVSDELIEQVNENYENALMINEIGIALGSASDADGVLEKVSHILHKHLRYDKGLLMLASSDKTRLDCRASFGYAAQEIKGARGRFFINGGQGDDLDSREIFAACFQSRKPVLLNAALEAGTSDSMKGFEFIRDKGTRVALSCPIIYEDEILGVLEVDRTSQDKPVFQRDINLLMGIANQIGVYVHKARLEEHFRMSQKTEAVGRLAGGVAHDFNNLLTVILSQCELSIHSLKEDHPVRERIMGIIKAGEKAAELTRKLLAYSSNQVLEMNVNNLNVVIDDMVRMLERVLGDDIVLKYDRCEAISNIVADPGEIDQVLMNLAINARYAMPNGGTLHIETCNVELDTGFTRNREEVGPGHYVMLSVSDTGMGMTSEVQNKIFEPFFSTKKGQGTGLGLATVYGIVKQHRGHIFVYSEVDKGTTFKLYFPALDKVPAEPAPKEAPREIPRSVKGGETILIVDDEHTISRMLMDTLKPLGYNLLEASSGEKALEICRSAQYGVDVLLTDIIMKGMDGQELADKVMKIYPDVKVVYMSGYSGTTFADGGEFPGNCRFMQKPFTTKTLNTTLRELLD